MWQRGDLEGWRVGDRLSLSMSFRVVMNSRVVDESVRWFEFLTLILKLIGDMYLGVPRGHPKGTLL